MDKVVGWVSSTAGVGTATAGIIVGMVACLAIEGRTGGTPGKLGAFVEGLPGGKLITGRK